MGKGPSNGGVVANRGFIFQAIVAEIQCLGRNDWDAIKVEPETTNDKVDIMLYKDGEELSAMQVKSSINPFSDTKVREWLEKLRDDAKGAKEICLYLVGYSYTPVCEDFIAEHPNEIKKVPFENLSIICTGTLVGYIRNAGVGGEVRVDDLEFIDDALFAKLFKNSIAKEPISRAAFEERFQKALSDHIIRKRLTSIPTVNHAVGLIGRDDIKKSIREMLEVNDCIVLVNGLGGIGKTAVMQHVCNDLKNEGKYVAWIESGGSLKEDLLLLRTGLGIPESDDADTAYKKIIKELKTNNQLASNFYLFLDNLSNRLNEDEQGVLNGLGIHVMATSRFEHEYFENLPLDVLVEDSALDMFYGYYLEKQRDKTRRHVDAALEIIGSVQSHTLLIELLAKAAWKKGGTLESFRDELKAKGVFNVFKRKLSTKHDKNRTIGECVMKLYEISDLSPAQQHIMKLFTIFTPEKEIYYEIGEWADLDMDAIDELVDLAWLERGGLENGYHIHQIVRDSLARQVGVVRLEDYGGFLHKVLDTNNYLGREVTYEKIRNRLVLVEDVARFFEKGGRKDVVGELLNKIANVYYAQGAYEKALEYYGKALVISEQGLGLSHPITTATYNNIANVFRAQGGYDKALEYYGKAIAIHERVYGSNYVGTAVLYNNMAFVYYNQGAYEKALKYYEKALAIYEKVPETDPIIAAKTYNNMGMVYSDQGDYERALEYYRKAFSIRERVLGTDHPDMAETYNNIGMVYNEQGDYENGLEYYRRALAIRERVQGMDHPDTALMYNNIAVLYRKQGNYGKALEYYGKALAIRERALGTGHPDTAQTYNNMACVYYAQGNYEKALEYNGKALAIRERVLGPGHPYTATTYNNMAEVFRAQGYYKKALEYYGKALAICERVLGTEHPDTAVMCNNMAVVYYVQGEYKKALEYNEKALAIRERVLGPGHPDTAQTYNNMAGVYADQGDYEKALEYYGKALAISERALGTGHPDMAMTYNNMARVYAEQRNYEKALEYNGKALAIRERALGTGHPDTATTYDNMAAVFRAQGDYEKALEYYGKALAIRERVLGTGHPDTATTYNNMGGVYADQRNYEKAMEYSQLALNTYMKIFGEEHPHTKLIKRNLDALLERMKTE